MVSSRVREDDIHQKLQVVKLSCKSYVDIVESVPERLEVGARTGGIPGDREEGAHTSLTCKCPARRRITGGRRRGRCRESQRPGLGRRRWSGGGRRPRPSKLPDIIGISRNNRNTDWNSSKRRSSHLPPGWRPHGRRHRRAAARDER